MDLCAVRGQADDLVSTRRPIRRAAFTLLEAVLALAILSSVLVVCLTVWQYKVTVGPPASAITREFLWHR